jgi:hypothetical protein
MGFGISFTYNDNLKVMFSSYDPPGGSYAGFDIANHPSTPLVDFQKSQLITSKHELHCNLPSDPYFHLRLVTVIVLFPSLPPLLGFLL